MAQLRHFALVLSLSLAALLFNQLSLRDAIPGPVGLQTPAFAAPQPPPGDRSAQRPDVGSEPPTKYCIYFRFFDGGGPSYVICVALQCLRPALQVICDLCLCDGLATCPTGPPSPAAGTAIQHHRLGRGMSSPSTRNIPSLCLPCINTLRSVSDPMPGAPTDPLPRVTIVSLSNSQRYCDQNALQNVMLQDYPHAKIDFIMLEVCTRPHRARPPAPRLGCFSHTRPW